MNKLILKIIQFTAEENVENIQSLLIYLSNILIKRRAEIILNDSLQ